MFTIAPPTGRVATNKPRYPFPAPVARALAARANLQLPADHCAPGDNGLRDAWESLVLTGRRAIEVLEL
ncbi:hypothetical protein NKH18_15010 [Streptomyces sp. M10(2022)]